MNLSLKPLDLALAWGLDAPAGEPAWIPCPHPAAVVALGPAFCLSLVPGTAVTGLAY